MSEVVERNGIDLVVVVVTDKLNAGDAVTLLAGGDSGTLDPPAEPAFETKAERERPTDGSKELSIELGLEWPENGTEGGELEIGQRIHPRGHSR